MYYILKDKLAIPCEDLVEWSVWMSKNENDCDVGKTDVEGTFVSTVFLGLDHQFHGGGDPLLFETMAFSEDGVVAGPIRTSSWGEAQANHDNTVKTIKRQLRKAKETASLEVEKIFTA